MDTYVGLHQKTMLIYLITLILNCNLDVILCTKCSYSFIINEMDPSDCPCLLDQGSTIATKSWIPSKKSIDNLDSDEIQSYDKTDNSINSANHVTADESRAMRDNLNELQKQYDSMYTKMKDLEIKMYKESMQNLELQRTVDKQDQTLKDYRFITERLKQGLDQTQQDLNTQQVQVQTELDVLQDQCDSNTETLHKHNDYLIGLERDTVVDRWVEDVRIDRKVERTSKKKHIPVRSAPDVMCDGISRNATKYKDCEELYERGHRQSGVYYITPDYAPCPVPVYCDMQTDGGGWLVFQRRQDGSQNFNRNWTSYRRGFGDLNGEFWLGNDNIFLLTNQRSYKLRIDVWDFNSTRTHAQYLYFMIGGERDKYRLMVMNHSGEMRDGLSHHNGQLFSTPDEDNDSWDAHHCAAEWSAGWWFDKCWFVILNGWYYHTPDAKYKGIAWNHWKPEQLMRTEMKIKPSDYM